MTAFLALGILASAASATPQVESVNLSCSPKDSTARVLQSPAPNDTHPDWTGESQLGTAWELRAHGRVKDDMGVRYLFGEIVSPRGGIISARAFVIEKEWTCEAR